MRKLFSIFIILSIVLMFLLAGCSYASEKETKKLSSKSIETENTTKTENTTEIEPTTEKITEPPTTKIDLEKEVFSRFTNKFVFSSGAGNWGTTLNINSDGSFDGIFTDSNMGVTGEGYPKGTIYKSVFNGQFENLTQINDYTYSMNMSSINYENQPDTEEIIDGAKYIYSTAYGLANATTVYIYTPDAPVSKLPEEFKSWIFDLRMNSEKKTLGFFALYNVDEQQGFSSSNK